MYEELEKVANLKFGKAVEEISKEFVEKVSDLASEIARWEPVKSGAHENAKLQLKIEHSKRIGEILATIWAELILLNDGALSEDAVTFIIEKVQNCVANHCKPDRLKDLAGWAQPRAEEGIRDNVGPIRRDLEIMRLEKSLHPVSRSATTSAVLVLISHSSKDVALATEVTEFLRVGLALRSEQIRCSSVDGYRLPAGVDTEAQLREEVNSATVLIGLITPNSLSSPYVLFELGARWGAKLHMIPLLAGVKPEEIRGPLSSLNALSSSSASQLHQLLANISESLNMPVQSAASYQRNLDAVVREAEVFSSTSAANVSQERMIFEESVYWKLNNENKEGPYCPTCYDDKKKEIHLTPGATKGTFHCGVCHNNFTTGEYDPKPMRRLSPRPGTWS